MKAKDKIAELEDRIKKLEARPPQYYPVYFPVYVQPTYVPVPNYFGIPPYVPYSPMYYGGGTAIGTYQGGLGYQGTITYGGAN